tara:strand:- start:302 stop:562 length:261 start_codon:yes stop_codon:yes gene_type:complete
VLYIICIKIRQINKNMFFLLKKLFLTITLNISFFLILMITIQNSSQKRNVNLLVTETVKLPISFIVGVSLISGSISASLLTLNSEE